MKTGTPSIYVATTADYNAGRLHGEWIDASTDTETMAGAVDRIRASTPEGWRHVYPSQEMRRRHPHGANAEAIARYKARRDFAAGGPSRPDTEVVILDTVGLGRMVEMYDSLDHVAEVVGLIEIYGEELLSEAVSYCGSLEDAKKMLEERLCASVDSVEDWAFEMLEETIDGLGDLAPYFDVEAWARDAMIDDYLSLEAGGQIHIFSRR